MGEEVREGPEDIDRILRPVRGGNWDQDRKPRHLPPLLQHADRATRL